MLLVLFRMLDVPDGASGREWALWLGLVGAAGIGVGSVMAMREEVRADAESARDRGNPGAAPVSIEPGIERTRRVHASRAGCSPTSAARSA